MDISKSLRILVIFLLSFCMFLNGLQGAETQKDDTSDEMDFPERMMMMKSTTVALRVGKENVLWGSIYPTIKRLLAQKTAAESEVNNNVAETKVRSYLQQLAQRTMFLQEARELKLEVTEEERKAYEHELEGLMKSRSRTIEDYKKALGNEPSTPAHVNYEDTLRLVKLEHLKVGEQDLTPQQLAQYRVYMQAMNQSMEMQNKQRRKRVEAIRKDPAIETAEGFAEMAKQFSEGKEGDFGGEMDYDFTREDLAEVNELKSFDWKVGETTPILETSNCFRIMRILRVVSPAQEGQPEKYRVAQMLFAKLPLDDTSDDAIKRRVLPRMRQAKLEEYAKELAQKYPVSTILFPDGLWVDPPEAVDENKEKSQKGEKQTGAKKTPIEAVPEEKK